MSKPLVSVIVPTYNSAVFLDACLASVKAQTYPNIELIVVDNNSTDGTKDIAKKYTEHVFNKGPERSAQRNFGVKQSSGQYVLIIDSDMELTSNIVSSCVEKIGEEAKAVIIPEESFGIGFWAKCKALERSFYVGIDWMEAARFFTREVFNQMNGYDEENTGTEDYDLPQRIEAKYGRRSITRTDQFIRHDEQKLSLIKTCRKKFYYAQKLDKYRDTPSNQINFKKQSNPLERYRLFFSQPKKLFAQPILGTGMLIMKTSEFSCGAIGYIKNSKRK